MKYTSRKSFIYEYAYQNRNNYYLLQIINVNGFYGAWFTMNGITDGFRVETQSQFHKLSHERKPSFIRRLETICSPCLSLSPDRVHIVWNIGITSMRRLLGV